MLPNLGRILQGAFPSLLSSPTESDLFSFSIAELLKLSTEVDLDTLTNTTRSMVTEFSEEVVPFAVELAQSLVRHCPFSPYRTMLTAPSPQVESYRRLIQETLESREKSGDAFDYGEDEKTLVMMNVLKTIEQLISSVREKKELVAEMEKAVVPLLEVTIRNSVVGAPFRPPSSLREHLLTYFEIRRAFRRDLRDPRLALLLPAVDLPVDVGVLRGDLRHAPE